ncbi:AP-1 complex subunit mu-2 [Glycine max]|nr:AP-1 complex subunit mu-2 [Glycine max]
MAGAASALFLLDIKGRVLIWRDYRGDVTAVEAERFFTKLIEKEGDPQSQDPVVYDNGVTYLFIQHSNVFLMMATRQNCNAASLLFFLHRIVDVFKHYFEELEEESLRDNFVVVYELLDEIMDFGYPQYTEAKILSEFIKTDAYRMEVTQRPPMAVTNAVSWRSEGINYKKNEVFLDVVESVNILVNSNGQIIRSDVVGALKMRTYLRQASTLGYVSSNFRQTFDYFFGTLQVPLNFFREVILHYPYYVISFINSQSFQSPTASPLLVVSTPALWTGMPECKLGLNDRVLLEAQGRTTKGKSIDLEDIKFHQCVRLARFENDRTISFIPPDGSFDLMTYRLSTQVKPLVWVEAQVEKHSKSRIEIMVKARSQFKERSTATNVEIELPVPADATNPNVRTSMGSASYAPEKDALIWKIRSFPGGKEYMLRAEFRLPSIVDEEATPERKAPIRVKFEIPYFTVSGIQVRYLKIIEKSGYQALPWVRYITMAGEYELRLI